MASGTNKIYEDRRPPRSVVRNTYHTLRVQNGVFRDNNHAFDYVEIGENA